ncbi:MAG: ABC transporter ATP-binding protein, partial [Armatimonadota bacterium]
MSELAISTMDLTKRFKRVLAVDGIDLQVPAGSVYGFLGRNGAGKTTTIQMLMGMLQPSGGEMRVLGFDPLREDVAMKRVVSYVPERVQMYDWMTVREIVWFGASIHPRWDSDAADALIERFDLPLRQKVGALSRGMQGKLALALAMASHPRLLILDDPTMGLDAVVRREFIESIVGVLQETGTSRSGRNKASSRREPRSDRRLATPSRLSRALTLGLPRPCEQPASPGSAS